ncbi:invasion associated locus B family protein [Hyphomicrobium sp.]|uniref:invasion associated locus B family protein n=1 Tax=Hyphomicrobium sp. TaxID=82 RepID=UPI002D779F40|nr:invasion associated locus B family protein [Hyphomicrobium sp.]HET6389290.1 invasion associated locus B family protein [Hyphomicrobium sp.]
MNARILHFTAFALLAGLASAAQAGVATSTDTSKAQATNEIIGDWRVTCGAPAKGRKTCVLSQTLISAKLKKPVGVLMISRDDGGKLKGSLRLPVGVALQAGVVLGLENQAAPLTLPYATCHHTGCFAPFDVSEPMLGQMGKASKISAVVQSTSKEPLNLTFSTRGFPAAYAAYVKASQ